MRRAGVVRNKIPKYSMICEKNHDRLYEKLRILKMLVLAYLYLYFNYTLTYAFACERIYPVADLITFTSTAPNER